MIRPFGYISCVTLCAWVLAMAPATTVRAADPMFLAGPQGSTSDPLGWELDEDLQPATANFPDPFEMINRQTLRFNQHLDRCLLNPLTRVYGFILPTPVRMSVRNFFTNLNCPPVMVNDLLQREWKDAGTTATRFALNSTAGVAGFFDIAAKIGWQTHESDFGQTLALAGVKSGPFIVLPVLGPTTARDGTGLLVDALFRPTTYLLGLGAEIVYRGSAGFVIRDANFDALQALEQSSVDYYAALRNAYYQDRIAAIWARRQHHRSPSNADGEGGGTDPQHQQASANGATRTGPSAIGDRWQPGSPPRLGPASRAVLRARWPRP